MKKNYKMTICYDGSRYYGWEHQPDRDTIQESLRMFLQECVENLLMFLVQAGQMPGYMPEGWLQMQFLMLQIKKEAGERTPDEIRDYMNRYLPDDIAVKEVREASERFHARYKAVGNCIVIPVMMD